MISALHSAARLSLDHPPPAFMAALQRATYQDRWALRPADLSSLIISLGRIGARPGRSRWLAELLLVVNRQAEHFTANQLIQVNYHMSDA